jgi:cullin 3
MYYEKHFEVRLLGNDFAMDLERGMIDKFQRPTDNKLVQNMVYKLQDIETNVSTRETYNRLNITITSDKFRGKINIGDLNPKIINPKICRRGAWSNSQDTEHEDITCPLELQAYISILDRFYAKRFPHRSLKFNFYQGEGILEFEVGGKKYDIQATTPQIIILMQFKDKQQITPTELSENTGIPLSEIGKILNVLFKVSLLARDKTKSPSDTSMTVFINNNFKYEASRFSLVRFENALSQQMQQQAQKNIDKEIAQKFAHDRETIVQAKIVRLLKMSKQMNADTLKEGVKNGLPFELDNEIFDKGIKLCVNEKYIELVNDNMYKYVDENDDYVEVD